ncbi:UNKNOWN [Stylonychia lemnae]|uniref:Uncharacterized protein n=1 Tax=Stylonychia lemnae TaxID=5949 RepID=A0A077ZWH8_STYLE|nr:UNKNOWN [Stylonychia lemnae]|eukprot:CDW74219.1 UNKNOWN [Stylonychia lemnae]
MAQNNINKLESYNEKQQSVGIVKASHKGSLNPLYNSGKSNFFTLSSLGKRNQKNNSEELDNHLYKTLNNKLFDFEKNSPKTLLKQPLQSKANMIRYYSNNNLTSTINAMKDHFLKQVHEKNLIKQRQYLLKRYKSSGLMIPNNRLITRPPSKIVVDESSIDLDNYIYLQRYQILDNKQNDAASLQMINNQQMQVIPSELDQYLVKLEKGETDFNTRRTTLSKQRNNFMINEQFRQDEAVTPSMSSYRPDYLSSNIREPRFNPIAQIQPEKVNLQQIRSRYLKANNSSKNLINKKTSSKPSDNQIVQYETLDEQNSMERTKSHQSPRVVIEQNLFNNQMIRPKTTISYQINGPDNYITVQNGPQGMKTRNLWSGKSNYFTGSSKKLILKSNDELFMNFFDATSLPSPPIIPIQEAVKMQNNCEKERYSKIQKELQKIQKVINNDPENKRYFALTDQEIDKFVQYLEFYHEPPFILQYTLKDLLMAIIDGNLDLVLKYQQKFDKRLPSPLASSSPQTKRYRGKSSKKIIINSVDYVPIKQVISHYKQEMVSNSCKIRFKSPIDIEQDKIKNLKAAEDPEYQSNKLALKQRYEIETLMKERDRYKKDQVDKMKNRMNSFMQDKMDKGLDLEANKKISTDINKVKNFYNMQYDSTIRLEIQS